MAVSEQAKIAEAPVRRRLLPYRWEMVGLLWIAFFLHQADRAVYNVVLPKLKVDLQLTDEQRAKLLMVGMQMLQSGKRGNLEKQVSAILKPEQRQRLKEIRMQLDGVNAMLGPKVSKELNLSADQLAKLRAIQTAARPAQAEKNASPEQRYLKVIAMRKEATTQALKILTPEQRAQFEKMQGKKVEFDLPASSVSKPKAQ